MRNLWVICLAITALGDKVFGSSSSAPPSSPKGENNFNNLLGRRESYFDSMSDTSDKTPTQKELIKIPGWGYAPSRLSDQEKIQKMSELDTQRELCNQKIMKLNSNTNISNCQEKAKTISNTATGYANKGKDIPEEDLNYLIGEYKKCVTLFNADSNACKAVPQKQVTAKNKGTTPAQPVTQNQPDKNKGTTPTKFNGPKEIIPGYEDPDKYVPWDHRKSEQNKQK